MTNCRFIKYVQPDIVTDLRALCDVHRADSALCTVAAEELEAQAIAIRRWLWLNHGHRGQYGDDGEMQCAACLQYGVVDYKRDTMERLSNAAGRALLARMQALEAVVEAVQEVRAECSLFASGHPESKSEVALNRLDNAFARLKESRGHS